MYNKTILKTCLFLKAHGLCSIAFKSNEFFQQRLPDKSPFQTKSIKKTFFLSRHKHKKFNDLYYHWTQLGGEWNIKISSQKLQRFS